MKQKRQLNGEAAAAEPAAVQRQQAAQQCTRDTRTQQPMPCGSGSSSLQAMQQLVSSRLTLPHVIDPPRNATVIGWPSSSLRPSRSKRCPEP